MGTGSQRSSPSATGETEPLKIKVMRRRRRSKRVERRGARKYTTRSNAAPVEARVSGAVARREAEGRSRRREVFRIQLALPLLVREDHG